ncbi:MAG: DUF6383 domain-containing protein [Paludibacter sp.]|nr:DUF6383 domain-containing protein [Paludibacter sp.]
MKKLITSLFILSTVIVSGFSQAAWDNFYVAGVDGKGKYTQDPDTMYVAIQCRNGAYDAMCANADGTLVGLPLSTDYNAGDSVTWRVEKGVPLGTTPRVRFVNVKTGMYLKQGTINGTLSPYLAAYSDTVPDAVMDFILRDQGTDSKGTYYYYITGNENNEFYNGGNNAESGTITVKSVDQGWKFVPRQGTQPKEALPTPALSLTFGETELHAGDLATVNVTVTKQNTDLFGQTLLYLGTELLDTISLDANGQATKSYEVTYGENIFTLAYSGDDNYVANYIRDTVNAGPSLNAKTTKITFSMPATSEVHKDVKVDFAVTTSSDDVVSSGTVTLFINGVAKNMVAVDVLGMGSITYPNFLVGTTTIKAIYAGDNVNYLNSDTTVTTIEMVPSTSNIKPYPVYFDLADQPEIREYDRKLNLITPADRPYSKAFTLDSLAGITLTDTISSVQVTYNVLAGTYDKSANCYNHADNIIVPLGYGRAGWMKIKTPWLNEGCYNVYLSDRVSVGKQINITQITMDDKPLYFPEEEMYGLWLNYWAGVNNRRQWNAKFYDGNLGMNYFGSVRVDNSGSHTLKFDFDKSVGDNVTLDMLQFIPVDMDSLTIYNTASENTSKTYYPLFSWTGFAYQPDYDASTVATSFADFTNLAPAYQVTDVTDWGTTYNYTIDSLEIKSVTIDGSEYTANYVTVYRAEDKWTRVSEGSSTGDIYSVDLPQGDYYYETINFVDVAYDGSVGYRKLISSGYFSLPSTGNKVVNSSNIKAYAYNKTLNVKGIHAGAKILVSDVTGRILINTTAKSDSYSATLPQGIYLVKVVSGETLRTKVLVK